MIARSLVCLLLLGFAVGCEQRSESAARPKPAPSRAAAASSAKHAASSAPSKSAASRSKPPAPACPEGMALVVGGDFWMGSDRKERFSDDESPRFRTALADFCIDVTEVTSAAYQACVDSGACKPAGNKSVHCTGGREKRADHPINCLTFTQAEAYCESRQARLPSELEFEYVSRGGSRYLKYPWGDAAPDGHTCWKHNGTCAVKSYPAGAFGLFDISGNVWEWNSDWYGAYPWPPENAHARVYRGGSFSRRFEKWMHTRLRNRAMPWDNGSHLGFRCAQRAPGATCPFGEHPGGRCRHGVVDLSCGDGERWNGVRCAAEGEPRCAKGRVEKAGYGCVLEVEATAEAEDVEGAMKNVRRERTPEFDSDCQTNLRDRPHAFRYVGGTHRARNHVGKQHGCKNRDVGVGWNSSCCP